MIRAHDHSSTDDIIHERFVMASDACMATLSRSPHLPFHLVAAAYQHETNLSTRPLRLLNIMTEKLKYKRVLGDWVLGKTLGQGSMGKVKLAFNSKSKEKVITFYSIL